MNPDDLRQAIATLGGVNAICLSNRTHTVLAVGDTLDGIPIKIRGRASVPPLRKVQDGGTVRWLYVD